MATTDKNTLKQWFKNGNKPPQEQFWAWIDSYWHKNEKIPITVIEGINEILINKADKAVVNELINWFNSLIDDTAENGTDKTWSIDKIKSQIPDQLTYGIVLDGGLEKTNTDLFYIAKNGVTEEMLTEELQDKINSSTEITVIDSLDSSSKKDPLSANMGNFVNKIKLDKYYNTTVINPTITFQNNRSLTDTGVIATTSGYKVSNFITKNDIYKVMLAGGWGGNKAFPFHGYASNEENIESIFKCGEMAAFSPVNQTLPIPDEVKYLRYYVPNNDDFFLSVTFYQGKSIQAALLNTVNDVSYDSDTSILSVGYTNSDKDKNYKLPTPISQKIYTQTDLAAVLNIPSTFSIRDFRIIKNEKQVTITANFIVTEESIFYSNIRVFTLPEELYPLFKTTAPITVYVDGVRTLVDVFATSTVEEDIDINYPGVYIYKGGSGMLTKNVPLNVYLSYVV